MVDVFATVSSWVSVKSLDVLQFSKSRLIQTLREKQKITVILEAFAVIANLNISDFWHKNHCQECLYRTTGISFIVLISAEMKMFLIYKVFTLPLGI